jgi:hypothetical protein
MTDKTAVGSQELSSDSSSFDAISSAYLPTKLPFLATAFCALFLSYWFCFELGIFSVGLAYFALFGLIFIALYRSQNTQISARACAFIVFGLWAVALLSSYLAEFPRLWYGAFVFSTYSMLRAKWASLAIAIVAPLLLFISRQDFGFEMLGAFIATAVFAHHARQLFDQYRDQLLFMSRQDPMSGCGNLQALKSDMEHHIQLLDRYKTPCTAMEITLQLESSDSKKAVLDESHPFYVLLNVCKSRIRQTDRLYRSGDVSFICLLANTSASDAVVLKNDILTSCEQYEIGGDERIELAIRMRACDESDQPLYWLEHLHNMDEASVVCGAEKAR